jgi:hypothetical protein
MNIAQLLTGRKAPDRRRYVELLHHFDAGNAKSLALLDELTRKLGISPEQVGMDFEVINEVKRLQGVFDGDELAELATDTIKADAAVAASFEAAQKFNRQWKESHAKLADDASAARSRQNEAGRARREADARLKELDGLRPDLIAA